MNINRVRKGVMARHSVIKAHTAACYVDLPCIIHVNAILVRVKQHVTN